MSPSASSSNNSIVQRSFAVGRHQSECTFGEGAHSAASRVKRPPSASNTSQVDSVCSIAATSRRKTPTSRSACGRVRVPRNKSSAQPPAIHHDARLDARRLAASVGSSVRQEPSATVSFANAQRFYWSADSETSSRTSATESPTWSVVSSASLITQGSSALLRAKSSHVCPDSYFNG